MNHHEADRVEPWAPSLAEIMAKAPREFPAPVYVQSEEPAPELARPSRFRRLRALFTR